MAAIEVMTIISSIGMRLLRWFPCLALARIALEIFVKYPSNHGFGLCNPNHIPQFPRRSSGATRYLCRVKRLCIVDAGIFGATRDHEIRPLRGGLLRNRDAPCRTVARDFLLRAVRYEGHAVSPRAPRRIATFVAASRAGHENRLRGTRNAFAARRLHEIPTEILP